MLTPLRLLVCSLFVFLLVLLPQMAQAQTHRYLSPTGTDSGDCPSGSPCATLPFALAVAGTGDIIQLAPGRYEQQLLINKPISLQGAGAGTDPATHTILASPSPTSGGSGITIQAGVSHVTIKDLRVEHFALGSGIYGQGRTDHLLIQNVQVFYNTGGTSANAGVHLNGPISHVTLDRVEARFNHTRGIVLWNGSTQYVSITNCTASDNQLAGIELQDGTASGVTVSGNLVENNGDSGMSLVGLTPGAGASQVTGNTVRNNGRFGIEVKLPQGSGLESGDGSIVISDNVVERTEPIALTEARDLAGICVYRRSWTPDNGDLPQGVVVKQNTVSGYRQPSASEGFGIVVEGTKMVILDNTVTDCEVAVQVQAGHLPYTPLTPTDGDQSNLADQFFGRGNFPKGEAEISGNLLTGNPTGVRYVGVPEPLALQATWTGTLSPEWTETANWQEQQVPTSQYDVTIPSGTIFSPNVTSDQAVRELTISEGSTLQVTGGRLQVKGAFTNHGTLAHSGSGCLTFTGNRQQTIGGSALTTFEVLTVGPAGVELTGPVAIRKRLILQGELRSGGHLLTLLSQENETAQVEHQGFFLSGPVQVSGLSPS